MRVSNLVVWEKAYEFALAVYRVTASFPNDEKYVLTSQLRRAALSISANIAEGKGRATEKDFLRFLHIARGSLEECKVYILFARDLSYINKQSHDELISSSEEIGRMLNGLIKNKTDSLFVKDEDVEYE